MYGENQVPIQLQNGMKVVILPNKQKKHGVVYVSLVIRNGRIDETKHNLSYTHMCEHMFAMLTSNRYAESENVKSRFGFLGVTCNAYTKTFETGYWFLSTQKNLDLILDLLASTFFDYTFTGDLKKQCNVVLEEMKSRNSGVWSDFEEQIRCTLYNGHRLGATWKEEAECIRRASKNQLTTYLRHKLDPSHATLFVEGTIENVSRLLSEIEKKFNRPKIGRKYKQHIEPVEIIEYPKSIQVSVPVSNISRVMFVYQIPDISRFDHHKNAAIKLLLQYFSSGFYSRLFQVLREKHGLVYGVQSSCDVSPVPHLIPGEFIIDIKVDPRHVQQVVDIVTAEIERVQQILPSRREMQGLRNNLRFQESMDISNYRPGKLAENCAIYTIWNNPIQSLSNSYKSMRNVKAQEIRDIARLIFRDKHKLLAIGEGTVKS